MNEPTVYTADNTVLIADADGPRARAVYIPSGVTLRQQHGNAGTLMALEDLRHGAPRCRVLLMPGLDRNENTR